MRKKGRGRGGMKRKEKALVCFSKNSVKEKQKNKRDSVLSPQPVRILEKHKTKRVKNKKKKKVEKKKRDKKDKKILEEEKDEEDEVNEIKIEEKLEKEKTVFWSNFQQTTSKKLKTGFSLPDQVKTFRVNILAVSKDGVYGMYNTTMTVNKPFNMLVETPLYIRPNETVVCRMVLENNKDIEINVDTLNRKIHIPPRSVYNIEFDMEQIRMPLTLEATDIESNKTLSHVLNFPVYQGLTYQKNKNIKFNVTKENTNNIGKTLIELPEEMTPDSLTLEIEYKQPSADVLIKGLDKIIREPCGCFEQTSATTFPLVMLLHYIDSLDKKSEKMLKMRVDAEEKMKRGIKRLLGYECKSGGFDWFGRDPGHVTLTAYGIWQFLEMNKLGDYIDVKIIDRTLDWLRKKYQNKKAEFEMPSRGFDAFSKPPQFCSDIYILFILTLMDDYHVNYKSIVSHKIEDYESKKQASDFDCYLSCFISLVYLGNLFFKKRIRKRKKKIFLCIFLFIWKR